MMQKGVVSVIFNREIYEMMVLIDIVSYLIKTMIRIIIILFLILFLLSCKTEKETQNAKEYLRWVGDIEKDTLTDNPNFKVCNGDEKIQVLLAYAIVFPLMVDYKTWYPTVLCTWHLIF